MTIRELKKYIEENLEDGTLNEDDRVYVPDGCEFVEANAVFNDAHTLSITVDDSFMGDQEVN